MEAWENTQSAKCLLCKHEDLNSGAQYIKKLAYSLSADG